MVYLVKMVYRKLSKREKISALLSCGECKTRKEAKIYLIDMGEWDE